MRRDKCAPGCRYRVETLSNYDKEAERMLNYWAEEGWVFVTMIRPGQVLLERVGDG